MTKESEPAVIREGKFSEVEKSETVDTTRKGEQTGTTVLVKKGIHVTCFQATFTLAPVTECTVTLDPKNGKAKLAGEGGMNESKPQTPPVGGETPPVGGETPPVGGSGGSSIGSDQGNGSTEDGDKNPKTP